MKDVNPQDDGLGKELEQRRGRLLAWIIACGLLMASFLISLTMYPQHWSVEFLVIAAGVVALAIGITIMELIDYRIPAAKRLKNQETPGGRT